MDEGWLAKVSSVLSAVRTPLALGGLTVVVLCVIYNRVLGLGIFSTLNGSETIELLTRMVNYVFLLAIVAVVLGVVGYIVRPSADKQPKKPTSGKP
jgi:hypothetical protein